MTEKFPDEFFRGITSNENITPEGYLMAGAFKFDSYNSDLRNGDGFCELSINWNDDEGAVQTILEQHKPGKAEKQFKEGYCVLQRNHLHLMFKQYIDDNNFAYERKAVEATKENDNQANPYHGNLLLKDSLNKNIKKTFNTHWLHWQEVLLEEMRNNSFIL